MLLLAIFLKDRYAGGVIVTVRNDSAQDLSAVTVSYTDGCVKLHTLPAGDEASWKINPGAESHLELKFADRTGAVHHLMLGCYIEHDYSGTLQIQIDSDLQVYFVDEVDGPYDGLWRTLGLVPPKNPRTLRASVPTEAPQ